MESPPKPRFQADGSPMKRPVVDGGVADVRPVVSPLDGEMAFDVAGVHGPLQPLDLILKRDRIAGLQRPDDIRIIDPAIAALRVIALERPEDDVLAGDHEASPRRLATRLREIALGAIGHGWDYMVPALSS